MSKKFDMLRFVSAMMVCEEEMTFSEIPMNPYVKEHIFTPLRNEEPVQFGELDFSQFSTDDIQELYNVCFRMSNRENQLQNICSSFWGQEAQSRLNRAFC